MWMHSTLQCSCRYITSSFPLAHKASMQRLHLALWMALYSLIVLMIPLRIYSPTHSLNLALSCVTILACLRNLITVLISLHNSPPPRPGSWAPTWSAFIHREAWVSYQSPPSQHYHVFTQSSRIISLCQFFIGYHVKMFKMVKGAYSYFVGNLPQSHWTSPGVGDLTVSDWYLEMSNIRLNPLTLTFAICWVQL